MRKDWSFLWTVLPPKHYLPMFFNCFAGETQRAFKDEQQTPTNTNYGIDMGHGIAECVKSRWKENIEKMKEAWVTIPFMMHWFAASPMVQLFVICQSHSTMQLRKRKWCKLILAVLTLINIELERHSKCIFNSKANASTPCFFFFIFQETDSSTNTHWVLPPPKLYSASPLYKTFKFCLLLNIFCLLPNLHIFPFSCMPSVFSLLCFPSVFSPCLL